MCMEMGIEKNGSCLRKLILCSALIHAAYQTQSASSLLNFAKLVDLQASLKVHCGTSYRARHTCRLHGNAVEALFDKKKTNSYQG